MTLWTVAHQGPLSMGFFRQEYWSGLPCPPPGYVCNPGIEPASLMSPALAVGFFTTSATWQAHTFKINNHINSMYSFDKIIFLDEIILNIMTVQPSYSVMFAK